MKRQNLKTNCSFVYITIFSKIALGRKKTKSQVGVVVG